MIPTAIEDAHGLFEKTRLAGHHLVINLLKKRGARLHVRDARICDLLGGLHIRLLGCPHMRRTLTQSLLSRHMRGAEYFDH